ncbi:MAG: thiamine-phosphate kinase [Frankia sp.]|nr:thiamine-phosphate kinase [Frankia sp.]
MRELGEFGLIAEITAGLPGHGRVLVGPGDDAAVVTTTDDRFVITTDALVENRHFRLDWSSAYDVGRKSAAQNLADVAAMGARPSALVMALAAPASLPVAWARGLADGLRDEAAVAGAAVVGGDITGADQIVIAVTATGYLDGRAPVLRSGARPGDRVVLAGRLGWSEAGLRLLLAGRREPAEVVAAHLRPAPPYPLGVELATAGATAMCDTSDGLLADLGHIAEASGVLIDVASAAIPLAGPVREAARLLGADPLTWLLAGGEDHALVATLPPGAPTPPGCHQIGTVTGGAPGVLVDGRPYTGPRGFDHYR